MDIRVRINVATEVDTSEFVSYMRIRIHIQNNCGYGWISDIIRIHLE